jgi:hypothetical protein
MVRASDRRPERRRRPPRREARDGRAHTAPPRQSLTARDRCWHGPDGRRPSPAGARTRDGTRPAWRETGAADALRAPGAPRPTRGPARSRERGGAARRGCGRPRRMTASLGWAPIGRRRSPAGTRGGPRLRQSPGAAKVRPVAQRSPREPPPAPATRRRLHVARLRRWPLPRWGDVRHATARRGGGRAAVPRVAARARLDRTAGPPRGRRGLEGVGTPTGRQRVRAGAPSVHAHARLDRRRRSRHPDA